MLIDVRFHLNEIIPGFNVLIQHSPQYFAHSHDIWVSLFDLSDWSLNYIFFVH